MSRFPIRQPVLTASLILLAAAPGGCSIYDTRYMFEPTPVEVVAIKPGAAGTAPVRTLVSVVGIRRADRRARLPASVEVRLRVVNTSPYSVRFDPASVVLYSAGLERMPEPVLRPPSATELAPDECHGLEALFPLPEGRQASEFDFSGVNVRWTLVIDGVPVTNSATFTRLPTAYYDRYPHRIGVGYHRYDY